ncbi:zinc transporter [Blastopirellula marina]|uniref:Zinc transporter n=1 Tax=Blastopirellula marina TaxID=124 RepID=A0A2S8FF85_9BACT|nr:MULTISPECIES: ZIP family metal transporter [Pirellulaceae]PQO30740.1 zinc transporter [Blastopirellula marina]RCS50877.1 ZIP family metal transporter [Bremerella cremea]
MNTLLWIICSGIAMSLIALIGSLTLALKQATLDKILLPLVAFAAGSLIGGALFHMIPASVQQMGNDISVYVWIVTGFLTFLALEQFLNWHHSHQIEAQKREPLTYLILVADGLHNFIGGLFVAASFLIDFRLGLTAWLAAAAHEVPQELGDFAVLVHGGWSKSGALLYNFLSGLTFLFGGLVAYGVSHSINVDFLVAFAAGNFLYIGAADLIPEIKKGSTLRINVIHFSAFAAGLAVLLTIRLWMTHDA